MPDYYSKHFASNVFKAAGVLLTVRAQVDNNFHITAKQFANGFVATANEGNAGIRIQWIDSV
jgi:hypothetical protein